MASAVLVFVVVSDQLGGIDPLAVLVTVCLCTMMSVGFIVVVGRIDLAELIHGYEMWFEEMA